MLHINSCFVLCVGEFEHEKPKYPVASPRKRSAGSAASVSSTDQRQVSLMYMIP